MFYALIAIAAGIAWLVLERSNELFVLSWRNGEMRLVRGSVPGRLRIDIGDALKSMKVKSTRVRVTRTAQGTTITASGLDDFHTQRLRNILQLFPLSQLRSSTAPTQNRLLRVFGFSSLVWLFGSRDCDE
ncbi:MAG: DUF3634 family protein [Archangium sp.]|nr:DUF3634 family protein [Archangium sp.]